MAHFSTVIEDGKDGVWLTSCVTSEALLDIWFNIRICEKYNARNTSQMWTYIS